MSSLRPPGKGIRRLTALCFFVLFILIPQAVSLGAGELYLPDLVIPRRSKKDIPQPYVQLNIDSDWIYRLPRHRRIYPLPINIDYSGVYRIPAPENHDLPLPVTLIFPEALNAQYFDLPIIVVRGENADFSFTDYPGNPVGTAFPRKKTSSGWRS